MAPSTSERRVIVVIAFPLSCRVKAFRLLYLIPLTEPVHESDVQHAATMSASGGTPSFSQAPVSFAHLVWRLCIYYCGHKPLCHWPKRSSKRVGGRSGDPQALPIPSALERLKSFIRSIRSSLNRTFGGI